MGNRFTRVPDRAAPSLDGPIGKLVPVADLFMLLMISRPRTGSLRNTWVTPATLVLCVSVFVIGAPAGGLLIALGAIASVLVGIALILVAIGAGAVAAVGTAQRRR
jgi:hypothetical protein